jgi:hypothetical protein
LNTLFNTNVRRYKGFFISFVMVRCVVHKGGRYVRRPTDL